MDPYIPNIYIYIYLDPYFCNYGDWDLIPNYEFESFYFYSINFLPFMSLMHIYTSHVSLMHIYRFYTSQWLSSSTSRCNISFPKKGKKMKCNTFLKKSVTLLNKPKQKSVTLFLFHKLSIKEKKKKSSTSFLSFFSLLMLVVFLNSLPPTPTFFFFL